MMLADYLAEQGRKPFCWGETDCLMLIAGWVALRTGIDPGAPYRGYSSEDGAAAIIGAAGGMVPLLDAAFAPCGLSRRAEALVGDVAVVMAPVALGAVVQTGAIRTSTGWIRRKLGGGLVCDAAPVAAAWGVTDA